MIIGDIRHLGNYAEKWVCEASEHHFQCVGAKRVVCQCVCVCTACFFELL